MEVLTTAAGIVYIAMFTQLVKSFIEAFGIKPDSALHDPLVWLVAFVSGIVGYVFFLVFTGPYTGLLVFQAAGMGVNAALSAVGAYHLATHPYFDNASTSGTTTTVTVRQPTLAVQQPQVVVTRQEVPQLAQENAAPPQ